MPIDQEMATILFADICGSTRIYEQSGDAVGQRIVTQTLSFLTKLAEENSGAVVNTIGDEIMCTFPNVRAGIDAACAMQGKIAAMVLPGYGRVFIRIGMHSGPIVRKGNEIYGDAVNTAARVAALAKSDEILTTKSTAELVVSARPESILRRIRRMAIKGKEEAIEIFEVVWQEDSLTRIGQLSSLTGEPSIHLVLNVRNEDLVMDAAHRPVTIGRSKKSDIVVEDEFTSRFHAKVECRQGKFFLCDQSMNGTYIRYNNGVVHTHREEMLLPEEGSISLGRKLPSDAPQAIRFRLQHS